MGYVEHYTASTLAVRSFAHPTHARVGLPVRCQIHPHLLCAPRHCQNCSAAGTQSSPPPKLVIILLHGGSNTIAATTKLVITIGCTEATIQAIAAATKTCHPYWLLGSSNTIAATTKTCYYFIARRPQLQSSPPPKLVIISLSGGSNTIVATTRSYRFVMHTVKTYVTTIKLSCGSSSQIAATTKSLCSYHRHYFQIRLASSSAKKGKIRAVAEPPPKTLAIQSR